jgi:hypothetical protein
LEMCRWDSRLDTPGQWVEHFTDNVSHVLFYFGN